MTVYDLSSLRVPALQGVGLDLAAKALENPRIRRLMMGRLFAQAGVTEFRQLALSGAPTPHPPVICSEPSPSDDTVALAKQEGLPAPKESPFVSVADLAAAYRSGEIDPVQVAHTLLDRVAELKTRENPSVLFIAQNHDDLLRQAHAAKDRITRNAALSSLDGVPVAIKDEVDQVPYPTTLGTGFLGKFPVTTDATVVARLRRMGALLVGKANMHEIGINPNGANLHFGLVRNPYHPDYDPGGSSSGSAAIVGHGLCPLAIGADGGGSVRIPAALSGVVGLKATYGRISEHGVPPVCWSVAHLGPIGAHVADVALGYACIAGPDADDPMTQHQPAVSLAKWGHKDLTGVRIGIFDAWFEHATRDVVTACKQAVAMMTDAGAEVVPIELPELNAIRIAHAISILSEMATAQAQYPLQNFAPHVRISLAIGRSLTGTDYIHAQRMRTRALAHLAQAFAKVDLIVTPATAITAPKIPVEDSLASWSDLSTVTEVMRYAFLANLTGHPALTLPVGYDPSGLPVALQIMGRHWEEHLVLQAAQVVEGECTRQAPPDYRSLVARPSSS